MVKVWDIQTGQELLKLENASGILAFSPDSKRLASSAKVWDAESGQHLLTLEGDVSGVAFSPGGKRMAGGGKAGVKVWDAQTGQKLLTLKGHAGFVYSVSSAPTANTWPAHPMTRR
jgi:WD40 repeat protein